MKKKNKSILIKVNILKELKKKSGSIKLAVIKFATNG